MNFPIILEGFFAGGERAILVNSVDELPFNYRFRIIMQNATQEHLAGVRSVLQHEEDDDIPF